jgi:hypothetical protein
MVRARAGCVTAKGVEVDIKAYVNVKINTKNVYHATMKSPPYPVTTEIDPLSVVEEHLGAMETWPTSIILHKFVEDLSEHSVREVAEFMCGNDVPI